MHIKPVDDGNDLFIVSDVIQQQTLDNLLNIDLNTYKHHGACKKILCDANWK